MWCKRVVAIGSRHGDADEIEYLSTYTSVIGHSAGGPVFISLPLPRSRGYRRDTKKPVGS